MEVVAAWINMEATWIGAVAVVVIALTSFVVIWQVAGLRWRLNADADTRHDQWLAEKLERETLPNIRISQQDADAKIQEWLEELKHETLQIQHSILESQRAICESLERLQRAGIWAKQSPPMSDVKRAEMTPVPVAEAQKLAAEWRPTPEAAP